jgi:hypothetical protein
MSGDINISVSCAASQIEDPNTAFLRVAKEGVVKLVLRGSLQ